MITQKKYPLAELVFDDNRHLLIFKVKQDIKVDVLQINEMIDYVKDFVGMKKHYAIVDFGSSVDSSLESRRIYAESEYLNTYRLADAFIVKSLATRMIANFFIKVNQPSIKTKMFLQEKEAIEWLESLKISDNVHR